MITSLHLLRAMREDVSNGHWAKCAFAEGDQRCLIAGARHHVGWEVFSEPLPGFARVPIHEYWDATEALAKAITRVYPRYTASDNMETIINFNDAPTTSKRRVIEVLDAAILDVEQGSLPATEEAILARA